MCAQPGKLLPSAHAVEREYRVMEAVRREGVPIPELLSLCEDSRYVSHSHSHSWSTFWFSIHYFFSVIGTPFYLMRYVPGRVFKSPALFELSAEERGGFYSAMCRVLAAIHSVNIAKVGLEDFGKKGSQPAMGRELVT